MNFPPVMDPIFDDSELDQASYAMYNSEFPLAAPPSAFTGRVGSLYDMPNEFEWLYENRRNLNSMLHPQDIGSMNMRRPRSSAQHPQRGGSGAFGGFDDPGMGPESELPAFTEDELQFTPTGGIKELLQMNLNLEKVLTRNYQLLNEIAMMKSHSSNGGQQMQARYARVENLARTSHYTITNMPERRSEDMRLQQASSSVWNAAMRKHSSTFPMKSSPPISNNGRAAPKPPQPKKQDRVLRVSIEPPADACEMDMGIFQGNPEKYLNVANANQQQQQQPAHDEAGTPRNPSSPSTVRVRQEPHHYTEPAPSTTSQSALSYTTSPSLRSASLEAPSLMSEMSSTIVTSTGANTETSDTEVGSVSRSHTSSVSHPPPGMQKQPSASPTSDVLLRSFQGPDGKLDQVKLESKYPERLYGTRRNIIINYLPPSCNEIHLRRLFQRYGDLKHIKIVRWPTGVSKEFGFVKFEHTESCFLAIEGCNGLWLDTKRIKVSLARKNSSTLQNANIIVKGLSNRCETSDLEALFKPFGTIIECRMLKKFKGVGPGMKGAAAIVRFDCSESATKAINDIDGATLPIGGPLEVRPMKKREKISRRLAKLGAGGKKAGHHPSGNRRRNTSKNFWKKKSYK